MSEVQKLRDKALHARKLAAALTDAHAKTALEALAEELDQQAIDTASRENAGN